MHHQGFPVRGRLFPNPPPSRREQEQMRGGRPLNESGPWRRMIPQQGGSPPHKRQPPMAPAQIQILRRPVKLPPVELPKKTRVEPPPADLSLEQPVHKEKREGLKILTKPKPPTPETTEEVKQKGEGRAIRKTEWAEELDINAPSRFENIKEPAMVYPFELDSFQKQAIVSLESGHHVFVSAHTSAGKTVVAEYAIALSKRNKSRSIYTSPIKALSNQKYYDFKKTFGEVGLITGDYQIDESADCLIMTTEILQSMLYHRSEKLDGLEFVVFDEVHYINDLDRGHVWEEVLILLPQHVQIVMLSATVPNTMEFADWVGRTKSRKVHVCSTTVRPVPLKHYMYVKEGAETFLFLLKSGDGPFDEQEHNNAKNHLKALQDNKREAERLRMVNDLELLQKQGVIRKQNPEEAVDSEVCQEMYINSMFNPKPNENEHAWSEFVYDLKEKDWLPTVVFVFSRKQCGELATNLTTDLTTNDEKAAVQMLINTHIEQLEPEDRQLPQIKILEELLKKGIGIHHSGILPLLKEIVEILFQRGLVKILFATETFAMGVNMPAKTVVFSSLRKFDGVTRRYLKPEEYIQMAGRAGRRGIDKEGNIIIFSPDGPIRKEFLQPIMMGSPYRLESKFKLTYHMILNILKSRSMGTVPGIMARSYFENPMRLKREKFRKELNQIESLEKAITISLQKNVTPEAISSLTKFYDLADKYFLQWHQNKDFFFCHPNFLNNLVPGRVVRVCFGSHINQLGVLLKTYQANSKRIYDVVILESTEAPKEHYIPHRGLDWKGTERWWHMMSLLPTLESEMKGATHHPTLISPSYIVGLSKMKYPFQQNDIQLIYNDFKQKNHLSWENSALTLQTQRLVYFIACMTTKQLPFFDENDVFFPNPDLEEVVKSLGDMRADLADIAEQPINLEQFKEVFLLREVQRRRSELNFDLSDQAMSHYPDYLAKKKLLEEKNYINSDDMLLLKGSVASRIGRNELIVAELLTDNIFSNLTPEEIAAILSCLVFPMKNKLDHELEVPEGITENLKKAIVRTNAIVEDIIKQEIDRGVEEPHESMCFDLVDVIYAWACQKTFFEVQKIKSFQEGLLVRWIQQLLELLKEVESAVRLTGDPICLGKVMKAASAIRRGIAFIPSIYTTSV